MLCKNEKRMIKYKWNIINSLTNHGFKQKWKYRKYIQKILYNYEIQLQKKLFYFSLFFLNIFSQ